MVSYKREMALRRFNYAVASQKQIKCVSPLNSGFFRKDAIRNFEMVLEAIACFKKLQDVCTYIFSQLALLYIDEGNFELSLHVIKEVQGRLGFLQTRLSNPIKKPFVAKETILEAYYYAVARYSESVRNFKTAAQFYTKAFVSSRN